MINVFYKRSLRLICGIGTMVVFLGPLYAQEDRLTKNQTEAINILIKEYIMGNPEVIVNALELMEQKQKLKRNLNARKSIRTLNQEIFYDPDTPVGGNLNGDVAIVEFFDYRCGYCKRVYPTITKVMEDDVNIRYIFKEYPILGPESVLASKIALAVWRIDKNKYERFHNKIMSARGGLTKSSLLQIASSMGINKTTILHEIGSKEIRQILQNNYKLAQSLNITGTPAFIIGDQIIPGAVDEKTLKQLVSKARKG